MRRPNLRASTFRLICATFLVPMAACAGCDDEGGTSADTIILDEMISEDTTLENVVDDPDIADYIVTRSLFGVTAGLTVEPGVRIEFESGGIATVTGSITAIGTAEEPIVFTGVDSIPGAWTGLVISSNDVTNELTHVVVSYGGADGVAGTTGRFNIGLGRGARVKITNSTISHSASMGLTTRLEPNLTDFANNTFTENEASAMQIAFDGAHYLDGDSTYVGNETDAVLVDAGTLSAEASWAALDVPYRLASSGIFAVRAPWTLEPGVTIEVGADSLVGVSDGSFTAVGTADAPITLTGVAKEAGAWKVLSIETSNVANEMSHCIVEFGGSNSIAGLGGPAAIGLKRSATLKLSDTTIRDSAGWAIWLETDAMLTESGNTYEDNALGDIGM